VLLVEEHQVVVLEELVEQEQILVHHFQVYLNQHLLVEVVVVEHLQVEQVELVAVVTQMLPLLKELQQPIQVVVAEDLVVLLPQAEEPVVQV
tara:strand:+ start:283 stop:558 length:276 start_codon:yes stop_codon:yes gene_type:complete